MKLRFLLMICFSVSGSNLGCAHEQLLGARDASVQLESCLSRYTSELEKCDYLRDEANRQYDDYAEAGIGNGWNETWTP